MKDEVQKLDSQLPVYEAKPLKEHMRLALFPLHAGAIVAGGFALLAMILAAIGIYGVMAYSVGRRTHEIGIRMALGAHANDVWKMVLKQGVMITAIGMVFGLVGAIGLPGVVASMLNGVSATDVDISVHYVVAVRSGPGGLLYSGAEGNESGSSHCDKEFAKDWRAGSARIRRRRDTLCVV